jgi:NAD(P)-dependent dehydrogenase (short-subunit alcohol dehydrogenase family)
VVSEPSRLLRPALLEDCVVVVSEGPEGDSVVALTAALGARVERVALEAADEEAAGAAVTAILDRHGRIDVVVVDAASPFGKGGDALAPFRTALDATWVLLRAVALRAWIPDEGRGGRALLLAPAPSAGPHAAAARAALENAARTLSIEWARHGVTTAALAPADATEPRDLHELVAFLASPAGAYYSGCLFTLGAARPATR